MTFCNRLIQMVSGEYLWPKFPNIHLTIEENPENT